MKMTENKGSAPKLTPQDIDAAIVKEAYHVFEGTTLTVCLLTLKNGYHVTGEAACVCPENFDAEKGRIEALKQAKNKIWMLEGYLLKQKLFEQS